MKTTRLILSPVRRRMRPRLPLCRPIAKWLGRPLTRLEDILFYAFQDMRRRRGCIRMTVCDPYGIDSRRTILTYMAYLADTNPAYTDVALVAPSKRTANILLGTTPVIAGRRLHRRGPLNLSIAGAGKQHALRGVPVNVAVLLDADCYRGLRNIYAGIMGSIQPGQGVFIIHSHIPLYIAPAYCNPGDFRRPPRDKPPEPVLREVVESFDEDTSNATHEQPPLPLPEFKPGAVPTMR